ncbi:MAG: ribbon-helix-helix protein, CopG family [Pseudomonadota bacterium]|nr:ribbon-helix-helix protein, CopG family [Pseudomonadota bacterium]
MEAPKINLNFRADAKKVAVLDALAKSLDRDRSYLLNEALSQYVELQSWQLEEIHQAIAEADAGKTVSHEEVLKQLAKRRKK